MFSHDLGKILNDAGIGTRPGYYSGRGATLADLDSRKLERAYDGIVEKWGREAGTAFVSMVEDMPTLSATDFLLTLAALEAAEFRWDKDLLSKARGVYTSDMGSAVGTVLSVMGGLRERDDTNRIRYDFLLDHGRKVDRSSPYAPEHHWKIYER